MIPLLVVGGRLLFLPARWRSFATHKATVTIDWDYYFK